MKKIVSIIIFAVMLISFAVPAYADMGPPVFYNFEVLVSNPDGAKAIDTDRDIVVPYQTKLTVTGEYKDDVTGLYLYYVEYEGEYFCISSDDAAKSEPKVGIGKAKKLRDVCERVVLNEDGVPLRDGPSESYDEVATIPYGVEFKSQYSSSEYEPAWIFVSYKDNSGWVYVYPDAEGIAGVNSNSRTNYVEIIEEGYYLYDEYDNKTEIPSGTKLNYRYYNTRTGAVYVEYNGVKGWLDRGYWNTDDGHVFDVVRGVDYGMYTNTSSVELYDEPYVDGYSSEPDVSTTVPAGKFVYITKATTSYYNDDSVDWYFAEYNGKSGWFKNEYSENVIDPVYVFIMERTGTATEDITVYSEPSDSSKEIGTINSGSNITYLPGSYCEDFGYYFLVECNGQYGWIPYSEDFDYTYVYFDKDFSFSLFMPEQSGKKDDKKKETEEENKAPVLIDKEEKEDKKETEEKKTFFTPQMIIAFCVAGACVIAGAAAAIIIVRKKKSKDTDF